MASTSHTRVTLTVYGPEPVIAAVESAVQADWARVLETAADDITMFIIDVAEPSAWQEPRTAFLHDPAVSGRLVAVSAEASDRELAQEGKEVPAPANSAAELLVSRLGERYRVELDHEESDLLSHDVRVEALIFPGRLPDGRPAYS